MFLSQIFLLSFNCTYILLSLYYQLTIHWPCSSWMGVSQLMNASWFVCPESSLQTLQSGRLALSLQCLQASCFVCTEGILRMRILWFREAGPLSTMFASLLLSLHSGQLANIAAGEAGLLSTTFANCPLPSLQLCLHQGHQFTPHMAQLKW